jgi:thiosulfate reductase cytochrome b subunit
MPNNSESVSYTFVIQIPGGQRAAPVASGTISQMADSVCVPASVSTASAAAVRPRHSAVVRAAHWITTLCFFALLVSGVEILISHPRFYWGEAGNALSPPLFKLPIPASRTSVPTGYGYVLPDQNGWSRYLHFQTAWVAVLTGLLYVAWGLVQGHFRRNLLPARAELTCRGIWAVIARDLRLKPARASETRSYNVLQRLTYLLVIFALFPLVIWTGLAMSPAIASAFPRAVAALGGQQSARTIHFFVSVLLVVFLLVHLVMICLTGFRNRMRAMVTGRPSSGMERL